MALQKRLNIYLTEEMYEWLRQYAFDNQISRNEIIRLALTHYKDTGEAMQEVADEKVQTQPIRSGVSVPVPTITSDPDVLCEWDYIDQLGKCNRGAQKDFVIPGHFQKYGKDVVKLCDKHFPLAEQMRDAG